MKRLYSLFAGTLLLLAVACGPKDADIQTGVNTAVASAATGVTASVTDGVVTLNGTVGDDASRLAAENAAKNVKGVKSVVNNIAVMAPVVPEVSISPDDALRNAVTDAIKDFPTAQVSVQDGEIAVTGELTADQWKRLKMALDGLNPKKVTATSLIIRK